MIMTIMTKRKQLIMIIDKRSMHSSGGQEEEEETKALYTKERGIIYKRRKPRYILTMFRQHVDILMNPTAGRSPTIFKKILDKLFKNLLGNSFQIINSNYKFFGGCSLHFPLFLLFICFHIIRPSLEGVRGEKAPLPIANPITSGSQEDH